VQDDHGRTVPVQDEGPLPALIARCVVGGTLMGLANLVPGISGGTMLLASGVYTHFIHGVAEVTTLRFRPRTLAVLAAIATAAALAILTLAGPVKDLVVGHRWIMYSLFIGLTLGGAPLVWRMLKPWTASAAAGAACGVAVMAAMAFVRPGAAGGADEPAYAMLFFAGLAGAAAMILPGISGGYLFLVLGQYLVILGAIDDAKTGLLAASGPDWERFFAAFHVFIPVGAGVAAGVAGVSNLIRFLLARHEKATLGLLLGLLLGAALGLWPFQHGVRPSPGDVVKGRVMTAESIAGLEPEDYPLAVFEPSAGQSAGALALAAAGYLLTQGVARIGGRRSGRREGGRRSTG